MTSINMGPLKDRALQFPEPIKSLILSEPDQIESTDFISKLETWEKLLRMNAGKKGGS